MNEVNPLTTFYLIRHGTTDGNAMGRFQGALDLPLNQLGLAQARCLGERFETVSIDFLYASPLIRAVQTAQGLRGAKDLPISIEAGLSEVNGGRIEGQLIQTINEEYPNLMYTFRYDLPNFAAPDGETTREVYDRMVRTVQTIIRRHPGKTIACVSHGFAIQTFLCYAQGIPFESMTQCILPNTAVCRFVFDAPDQLPVVDFIGDDSHLPEALHFEQPKSFRA